MDITSTTTPDSTQVNAEDLLTGPRVVTITGVRAGTSEQPVNIDLAEFPGRAYRPSKTMRRVLVALWGPEASAYVGRRLRIYRDPDVRFGKDVVGGIKIAAMSHIDKPVTVALTVTRGRRAPHTVEPLAVEYQPIPESFAAKVRAGNLTDEDRQKATDYLAKLSNADPAKVSELRTLVIGQESTDGQ